MAREGRAWTVVAVHLAAVQQIAGFWLLLSRVQEGRGASAAQEARARRHPDEKLQAYVESVVPVEAAGENRTESAADLLGWQLSDADDTVGVPPVRQHRDCRHDGLQQHADGG